MEMQILLLVDANDSHINISHVEVLNRFKSSPAQTIG
jgi:hypothetical protein